MARGMVQSYQHPRVEEVLYPTSPVKWSDWEALQIARPHSGQHTSEVLRARLGMAEAEVQDLAEASMFKVSPEEG